MIENKQNEKIYRIETCKFQREKDSEWEPGILFNEGDMGIHDAQNQKPDQVWDFKQTPGFCLDISDLDYWMPYINNWIEHIKKLILG